MFKHNNSTYIFQLLSLLKQIIVTSHSFSHKANDDSTKDEMVTHINCYRACHSAPALTRDAQVHAISIFILVDV